MPIVADPIIDLPYAKSFLKMIEPNTDELLTSFIAAASQMIVNKIGVVSGSPVVSEWHDGGADRIVLRNLGPILSVTTVLESYGSITYTLTQEDLSGDDTSDDGYAYTVDLDAGLIVRRASGVAIPFASGVRNVLVVYVAGYTVTPADIQHACGVLVKHLWETQRGASRSGSGPNMPDGSAYSFPHRVEEILAPYVVPGIA